MPLALQKLSRLEQKKYALASQVLPDKVKRQITKVANETDRHIFIIIGQPRTGKTTLAAFASVSDSVLLFDTDHLHDEEKINLEQYIEDELRAFLQQEQQRILVLTVGRWRRRNNEIIQMVKGIAQDKALITICETGIA